MGPKSAAQGWQSPRTYVIPGVGRARLVFPDEDGPVPASDRDHMAPTRGEPHPRHVLRVAHERAVLAA